MKDEVKIYDKFDKKVIKKFTISTIYKFPHFFYENLLFYITNILLTFLKLQKHSVLLIYKIFYLNKRKIIFFNIKILKMSSKFCKNQLYSSYFLGLFITKLYTIFYYLHYFRNSLIILYGEIYLLIVTILQKFTYYFRLLY